MDRIKELKIMEELIERILMECDDTLEEQLEKTLFNLRIDIKKEKEESQKQNKNS